MGKVKRILKKIVYLGIIVGAIYSAQYLYTPSVKYTTGEEVSRWTLKSYWSKEKQVLITEDFKRFLLTRNLKKAARKELESSGKILLDANYYRTLLEREGIIKEYEEKKEKVREYAIKGSLIVAYFGVMFLFFIPYYRVRQKRFKEERIREENDRQFQEHQKKKRESYEAERRADDERRRLEELAREREAKLRKENDEREKREKDEFQCYYESIKEEVKGSSDEEILIQLLRKYLKKPLMEGTSKSIQIKIEEIENERTKNKIAAIAREDMNRERQAKEEERAEEKEGAGKEETGDDDMYLA